ncbi:MAG: hypothetical protein J0653_04245, partial [Deltaproteobacteria bacterium]|nr:hypothetical protein [Deltaproteobacteria bacterium]
AVSESSTASIAQEAAKSVADVITVQEISVAETTVSAPILEAVVTTAATIEAPVQATEVVLLPAETILEPVVVEIPVSTEPAESPRFAQETTILPVAVTEIPVVDISKMIEASGLVLVETSSDKVFSQPIETISSEATPRPRRKRPTPVQIKDEPLVMVETQKQD